MKAFRIILSTLLVAFANCAIAQEFFSKETSENLFDVGVRLGFNTSNRTFNKKPFDIWNINSWGTGIDLGFVADINFRDYFSLQPGIFFESRSGNYSYSQTYTGSDGKPDDFTQLGHDRSYNLNVPVMASVKFNLAETVKLITEAGPYVQCFFRDSANGKVQLIEQASSGWVDIKRGKTSRFDIGLKIGAGISYNRHYSFYIHYLAGMRKAWENPWSGGHNKAWVFSVGYTL